jgi:hypothetical protein
LYKNFCCQIPKFGSAIAQVALTKEIQFMYVVQTPQRRPKLMPVADARGLPFIAWKMQLLSSFEINPNW